MLKGYGIGRGPHQYWLHAKLLFVVFLVVCLLLFGLVMLGVGAIKK